jgi:hypothetical protein
MVGRFLVPQADHRSVAAFTGKIVAKFSLASISIVASAIYCLAVWRKPVGSAKWAYRPGEERMLSGTAGRSGDPAQGESRYQNADRSPQGSQPRQKKNPVSAPETVAQ